VPSSQRVNATVEPFLDCGCPVEIIRNAWPRSSQAHPPAWCSKPFIVLELVIGQSYPGCNPELITTWRCNRLRARRSSHGYFDLAPRRKSTLPYHPSPALKMSLNALKTSSESKLQQKPLADDSRSSSTHSATTDPQDMEALPQGALLMDKIVLSSLRIYQHHLHLLLCHSRRKRSKHP
jgi:hypothetical protein